MRPRKFLLVTKALTTAGLLAACKKDDLPPTPGNPKGTWAVEHHDGGTPVTTEPPPQPSASTNASTPLVPVACTPPTAIPPPGNPKGSGYDTPKAPPLNKPVGNPKGSHYDAGKPKKPVVDDSR